MAILRRISDGEGEQGARCDAYTEEKGKLVLKGHRPIVGCILVVGSVTARSYSNRDWWATTPVTEILEDTDGYVMFKTKNSTYEWWK